MEDFTEAQSLLPKSPDPELGLARVYVYGLKDIDKACDALQQAESRGYQPGARDMAQLADGYRDRADRLLWDSRNVRGLPQEKDQIQRAAGGLPDRSGLYQSIAPYGNASAQIVRVQTTGKRRDTLAAVGRSPMCRPLNRARWRASWAPARASADC